jgi:hypothetical protein
MNVQVKYPPISQDVQTNTEKEMENVSTNVYNDLPNSENINTELFELRCDNTIYKRLLNILKFSYKIPDKLLDEGRRLIISKTELRKFIASLLNTQADKVFITSKVEPGCVCLSDIESIADIKIKISERAYRSLEIFYNEIYNKITEEFNISLSKMIGK